MEKAQNKYNIENIIKVINIEEYREVPKIKEDKMTISYNEVTKFWFEEIKPEQRWKKNAEFDAVIAKRFGDVHEKATRGELKFWRRNALGTLAEIIVLDQFSRNIFRDTPSAFASDELALEAAKEAIEKGYDKELDINYRSFLYMPFMHSESTNVHEIAMKLFNQKGLEGSYDYEVKHKNIIDRFGRYPHRNEILDRESTSEEIEFLKGPDSSF